MSLACGCYESDDGTWWYPPQATTPMPARKRRCRCQSCRRLLAGGEEVYRVCRERRCETDIEERIYGDEVPLAPWWLCEECGDLWLSLLELGYCTQPDEVREDHAEYVAMVAWERAGRPGPEPRA